MKDFIIDTWIGRGLLTFVLSMIFVYIPFLKNRNHEPTWITQLVILVMCIMFGKIGSWLMLIVAIVNYKEIIKYYYNGNRTKNE